MRPFTKPVPTWSEAVCVRGLGVTGEGDMQARNDEGDVFRRRVGLEVNAVLGAYEEMSGERNFEKVDSEWRA